MSEEKKTDYKCLSVTRVDVYPFKEGMRLGTIKAMASIVLNDQLTVRGLRVTYGVNGLFVGWPCDPFFKGEETRYVATPMTRELREHIENCILEKYQQVTG